MNETDNDILQLPPECGMEALQATLGSAFALREGGCGEERFTFYDTWEWNLWFRRQWLFTSGGALHFAEGERGWPGTAWVTADDPKPFPRFARDFADPRMRKALSKTAGLRALSAVASLRTAKRTVELLDGNRKVVCRLELTEFSPDHGEPFHRLVEIRLLRGYEAEADSARELLEACGAAPPTTGPLDALFEREGRTPQPYTLKPMFDLAPDTGAREAVRKIVRRMLAIGLSNEPGIVEDIDTEFLHDYRICIRKIRSVLSLVKGVYPPERTESLKRTLSELGGATNRLRDLDVYLLSRGEYASLLPESLRAGLQTLFDDFAHERKETLAALRTHLASPEYRRGVRALERFFEEPDSLPPSETSNHPIGPLVARPIRKRYRAIRKDRRTLTPETPDESVHRLRIDCKKLRYLLEFFGEIFPADAVAPIQKQLRRLQNRLGRFNDYSVHQRALLDYWERKRSQDGDRERSDALATSLGGLVAALYQRQRIELERIRAELDAFCGKDVRRLFDQTFKADPGASPGPYAIR